MKVKAPGWGKNKQHCTGQGWKKKANQRAIYIDFTVHIHNNSLNDELQEQQRELDAVKAEKNKVTITIIVIEKIMIT